MARPVNAISPRFNYISANPNETVHSEPFCRGSAERFMLSTENVSDGLSRISIAATGLRLEEPRTGMNLNGTTMNQRSVKLSSSSNDLDLTGMEITCLKLTANGLKPAEIGSALHADEEQVEIHLAGAQRKLGARNRLHAVGIAVSQGLIGIDGK